MNEDKLGLFEGEDKPTVRVVWDFYEKAKQEKEGKMREEV